jgi:hypothetical protein
MNDLLRKEHATREIKRIWRKKLDANKEREITKAVYLVGTTRGLYAGHAAMLFIDKAGYGTLYSSQFDTTLLKEVAKGKWIPYEIFKQELNPKEVKAYFKTGKIPSKNTNYLARLYLSDYDKYISIPVKNKDLGNFMKERAEEIHKGPGLFNLYERNCNHLCQDILSAGGYNFGPTRGSCAMVTDQIENAEKYVKKWKLLKALYYALDCYRKDFELGIVPNGAYEKGVEWAKKNNYEYGSIGKPKFVLKESSMPKEKASLEMTIM